MVFVEEPPIDSSKVDPHTRSEYERRLEEIRIATRRTVVVSMCVFGTLLLATFGSGIALVIWQFSEVHAFWEMAPWWALILCGLGLLLVLAAVFILCICGAGVAALRVNASARSLLHELEHHLIPANEVTRMTWRAFEEEHPRGSRYVRDILREAR
ncbi:MAG: hypothetical protein Q8R32_00175 [bacterium]|nr:hypothetical protein [bacterium]